MSDLLGVVHSSVTAGHTIHLLFTTAIARCRPTGALHNPFQPEFTEYIVYANLDSHEEETQSPIVEEPSQRTELVKILLKFPIDLDL